MNSEDKKTYNHLRLTAAALGMGIVVILGAPFIVSCSSKNPEQKLLTDSKEKSELTFEHPEGLNKKVFEPYEHVYFKRYDLLMGNGWSESVLGGQIEVPEGYEIFEIENFEETKSQGSQTRGFDVWFINKTTVEVQPVYNEFYQTYDYSEPGIVVELEDEKILEKTL